MVPNGEERLHMPLHNVLNRNLEPLVRPYVDYLKMLVKEGKHDHVVKHSEIAELLKVNYATKEYYTLVVAAHKRLFREIGVSMVKEPRVGYVLPSARLQMVDATNRTQRHARGIARAGRQISSISEDRMRTTEERAMRTTLEAGMRLLGESIRAESARIKLTIGPTRGN